MNNHHAYDGTQHAANTTTKAISILVTFLFAKTIFA